MILAQFVLLNLRLDLYMRVCRTVKAQEKNK